MVLILLNVVEKSSVNAGMPEKSQSGINISTNFQLLQFGIRVSPLVTD
jgi:hypothetical protein